MRTYNPAGSLAVLEDVLSDPSMARGVVHHEILPPRPALHGDWPEWLDPRLRAGLAARGIERPYLHQVEAIEAAHAGEDVVVVTPTASGKSLAYAVPILRAPHHRRVQIQPASHVLPPSRPRQGCRGKVQDAS